MNWAWLVVALLFVVILLMAAQRFVVEEELKALREENKDLREGLTRSVNSAIEDLNKVAEGLADLDPDDDPGEPHLRLIRFDNTTVK